MALIQAIGLSKTYYLKTFLGKHTITALREVTIEVPEDSIIAVVGESGSGKSTLARMILALERPDNGKVLFKGQGISSFDRAQWKVFRRSVSVVFQDPLASLNPRMNVYSILSEPLRVHRICPKKEIRDRVVGLLKAVELGPEHINRYPHEFSGGQRQRLCIARALALEPQLLVADEPLSALDVSVQAQIVSLLQKLKAQRRLSILLVSHDLELVHYLADYVYIMYQGRVLEEGHAEELFNNPLHPYTRLLLEAAPRIKGPKRAYPQKIPLAEDTVKGKGCPFYERCPDRMPICVKDSPSLKKVASRKVACFKS